MFHGVGDPTRAVLDYGGNPGGYDALPPGPEILEVEINVT